MENAGPPSPGDHETEPIRSASLVAGFARIQPCDASTWDVKRGWFAVVTVLAFGWFPYLAAAILYRMFTDDSANWPYIANSLWEIVQHSVIVIAILYVMYCDGRPWSAFGIRRPRLLDPVFAILVLIVSGMVLATIYMLAGAVVGMEAVEQFSDSSYQFDFPASLAEFFILLLLSLSIGLNEELVMRGYLIPTFERLLKSTWLSVLLTSALFASYHIFRGSVPWCGPLCWASCLASCSAGYASCGR